jgi:hypothetical protein
MKHGFILVSAVNEDTSCMGYNASQITHSENISYWNTHLYSYSVGILIIFNLIYSFSTLDVDLVYAPEAKETIRFSHKLEPKSFIPWWERTLYQCARKLVCVWWVPGFASMKLRLLCSACVFLKMCCFCF